MATYDYDDEDYVDDDDDDYYDDFVVDDDDTMIFENMERFKLSVFLNLISPHLEMSCSE